VLAAAALWSTFGLFAKVLYARGYAPLELASIRSWIGWAGVGMVALLTRTSLHIDRRQGPFFAAYGIVGFAAFETLFFATLERTDVGVAAALLYTAPAFVVLLSRLLWREAIPPFRWAALVALLVGIGLVTGAVGMLTRGTAPLTGLALLLGLGSGLTYALYTLFSKVAMERHSPVTAVFWSFAFASLVLALVAEPVGPLLRAGGDLWILVALGIVPTLLPYLLYLRALRTLTASSAAMLAAAEPVMAALLGMAALGERMGALRWSGVVVVAAAAALLARRVRRADEPI
jgi:drug/metabolite transporter (DMT)-like permease